MQHNIFVDYATKWSLAELFNREAVTFCATEY